MTRQLSNVEVRQLLMLHKLMAPPWNDFTHSQKCRVLRVFRRSGFAAALNEMNRLEAVNEILNRECP